jgi:hypothetical protein
MYKTRYQNSQVDKNHGIISKLGISKQSLYLNGLANFKVPLLGSSNVIPRMTCGGWIQVINIESSGELRSYKLFILTIFIIIHKIFYL